MRLVIDTNILISALLAGTLLPARLIVLWREGRFDLLTSTEQLDKLMAAGLLESRNPVVDQFTHRRREGPTQVELRK